MTLSELSQLYYLKREIELDKQRLSEIRSRLYSPLTPVFSNTPKSHCRSPHLLENDTIIAYELEQLIRQKIDRCHAERLKLEKYIETISDSMTRQIFTLRFASGLSWQAVAMKIGGNNTADSVRMICFRYLKKS